MKLKSKIHTWNDHTFILDYNYDTKVFSEELRMLWVGGEGKTGVLKQLVDDYICFRYSKDPAERALCATAKEIIFNDNYKFCFDTPSKKHPEDYVEVTLSELLDFLGTDVTTFREHVVRKDKEVNAGKTMLPGTQVELF